MTLPIAPLALLLVPAPLERPAQEDPAAALSRALEELHGLLEPAADEAARTLQGRVRLTAANGGLEDLVGAELHFAWSAPDRLRLEAEIDGRHIRLGRAGQELWIHAPEQDLAVRGRAGLPRFAAAPNELDASQLEPWGSPVEGSLLGLLPMFFRIEGGQQELRAGAPTTYVSARPRGLAVSRLGIPDAHYELWVRRDGSHLPAAVRFTDAAGAATELALELVAEPAWEAERFELAPEEDDQVEEVALAHLVRFGAVASSLLDNQIPALGPPSGERRLLARHGRGRLEEHDDTLVLFLSGSPEEMGEQHGVLLREQVRDVMDRFLYGIGVGSSFEKGRWFLDEIEEAQSRLLPHMDARYLREMDALAEAAGLHREEARLGNFFPELFHCSGFALYGSATQGGALYHGRILDYMKGVGLEQNAVLMVVQPDEGNAWVNVGYAGFVGTVTAMNEKQLALGEMGGRGEGQWDGVPMAQLMRMVMERCDTLEEALALMESVPRTCEYYYVLSDAKSMRAVGIAATPDSFETIWAGDAHELLPHAVPDAVLLSGGERYEELVRRVRAAHGGLDAAGARDLMRRPVAMSSNIQSVLMAPGTLELWVATAENDAVASHCRYTHYDLAELLGRESLVLANRR